MVTIRPAGQDDVDIAAGLARQAYGHYTARIGRPPAPVGADYAAAVRGATMWVAEDHGRVVGLLVLLDGDGRLLLDNVAVDPSAQGRGVGARLLAFAEDEARRRGHDRIELYTNEAMTENLDYYPHQGYVETHRAEQDGYRRVFFTKRLSPA
ncbi:GNAT family N-acetyltransferase [Pseudonocardia tropica]|uniref:GNAT family N-acetyltransferase n=1 Tax=Pseudonocardia tropica TaxID=681289 RepID=A0ABV1JZA2_9PSEU